MDREKSAIETFKEMLNKEAYNRTSCEGNAIDNLDGHTIARTMMEEYDHQQELKEQRVSHPPHYTWLKEKCGIEVIDITRHMDFDLGCAIKYILRAGHKSEEGMTDKEKTIEDLKKAIWYINDKIKTLELC